MEAAGEQNEDLQIQNLSDDEELYSGVDYSDKAEETKPVTIKSNSQSSLQDVTEIDQESNNGFVITKEKIFQKTIVTTRVLSPSSETETETNLETETNVETDENNDNSSKSNMNTEEGTKDSNDDGNKSNTNDGEEIKGNNDNGNKSNSNDGEEIKDNNDNGNKSNSNDEKKIKDNNNEDETKNNNDESIIEKERKGENSNDDDNKNNTNDNPNNENNDFNCTYSFKANKSKKDNHNTVSINDPQDPNNNNNNKKMIRPHTAMPSQHLRSSERNMRHKKSNTTPEDNTIRSHTSPSDKHNRFNSYGENDKQKGTRDRRMKKLHFADEEDYDKESGRKDRISAKKKSEIKDKAVEEELQRIEAEKRRVIEGDISVHSTDDEGEDDEKVAGVKKRGYQPHERNTTAASNCSKSTKASGASKSSSTKKKGTGSKKSLKNNYRAFVSIKPSCNRYMANMWNNYCYSIHKMNIQNIKKTVDNDAPKRYIHIDQKLKARQMKKERDDEIRRNNQNILNRMIYQGKNNVGTSNLDDNNDVIEPVFRSLHADKNRRLENEMNRESMTLLKRLKEKKPYCSVEQWKKERIITEMYLRNISTYPENYPIRQKPQQKHVPPIKKNENEELKREKSPLEQTYGTKPKMNRGKRCSTSNTNNSSGKNLRKCNNEKNRSISTANKDDNTENRTRKPKQRTLSESTRQSVKLYADTSVNQNQVDRLFAEQKNNAKLYKVPENNTSTAFDRVLNNYEKVESDIKEDVNTVKASGNDNINNIKDIISDINEVSNEISTHLNNNENKPVVEEIPVTEVEKK